MNFYKRHKISSWAVKITKEMSDIAMQLSQEMLQFFHRKVLKIQPLGKIDFIDPYTGEKKIIGVSVAPGENNPDRISIYGPENFSLMLYPNNLHGSFSDTSVINSYYQSILHELTHSVDPKMQSGSGFNGINKVDQINKSKDINDYYNFYPEFDAYCRQIIEHVRLQISQNPNEKTSLTKWLESSKVLSFPFVIQPYRSIISSWYQNDTKHKTDYIKKLKIRLYNELIKG